MLGFVKLPLLSFKFKQPPNAFNCSLSKAKLIRCNHSTVCDIGAVG